MPWKRDKRFDFLAQCAKLFSTAQIRKIDDQGAADNLCAGPLKKPDRREAGSARGDEVIDDKDMVAMLHGVCVYFHAVGSIFQRVILAQHLPGQFAFLAHRNEPDRQLVCYGAAEDKAACL